jgi:hypothetical protein
MLPLNLCELRVTFGEKLTGDQGSFDYEPHTPTGEGWCLIDFRATSDQHGEMSGVYVWARPRGRQP